MSFNKPNTKSIARIAAVQAIYQYYNSKGDVDIKIIISNLKEFYKDPELNSDYDNIDNRIKLKPSYKHFEDLVIFTEQNLISNNDIIEKYLQEEWQINDLSLLLQSILQIALSELKIFKEIPYKVIIDQYTNIASDMLSSKEAGFVNSLLDNYFQDNK